MKFLLTLVVVLCLTVSHAQKIKPSSTNDFVIDCMATSENGNNKQMALWFPYQYWEVVGDAMKASPAFIESLSLQMKGYMLFCVVDYIVSTTGMSYKSDAEIRKTIKLMDSANNVLRPLEDKEILPDVKRLVGSLKPIMAQLMGQLGEGMQIYLFKAPQINGQPAINILSKNKFSLSWNNNKLNWKLPFASIMPPKFCPVDKEKMKGNWDYCPTHGNKLD
jgi:hypothetical protein